MTQYRGVYVVRQNIATVTTAVTLLQLKAGAGNPLELLRASVTAESTTSDEMVIQVLRKSATATVTSFTPLLKRPDMPVAAAAGGTAATGHTATVEGTDDDILYEESVNVLNGFVYVPVPEEREWVDVAGFLALKSAIAITSVTLRCVFVFGEF